MQAGYKSLFHKKIRSCGIKITGKGYQIQGYPPLAKKGEKASVEIVLCKEPHSLILTKYVVVSRRCIFPIT